MWVLEPKFTEDEDWAGCTMTELESSSCAEDLDNAQILCDWLNEVHRWAIERHATACKNELKICMNAVIGVRTSDIMPLYSDTEVQDDQSKEEKGEKDGQDDGDGQATKDAK
jgi:hypothetical protein